MSVPTFSSIGRAGELISPQVTEAVRAGLRESTPPVEQDGRTIALMLVDAQVDFVHEDGALSVPGAVEDAKRTAEWLYRNTARITRIFASLDSHTPLQIFFPTWWVDVEGEHPDPYTAITVEAVENGSWRPLYEVDWSVDYVHALQDQAKKDLMIWPFHVLVGTPGHALTPILYEAIAYHSAARSTQPTFEIKGMIDKTEYYSLLEPEVKVPEDPRGTLNEALLEQLLSFDALYFAGQAKSHCVLETVASIVRRHGGDRKVMEKLYLLEDCTSAVQHPEIDFDALASEAFNAFAEKGMQIVSSADEVL
ncbi:MAG: cysteine hydrolase family protein [Anaerolineales bacterium]|nr:cysteine hydrolase family protein [Anaerolineales bacterium]